MLHRDDQVNAPNRHCEPTGPAQSGRPDDKLREAIQACAPTPGLLRRFAPRNDDFPSEQTFLSELSARRLLKGSGLGAEELAPAFRVDRAVDDLAGVGRLELDASVALLIVVRMILVFCVRLLDLLLRRGPRCRRAGCDCADCHRGSGDHHAPRNATAKLLAIAHDPLREIAKGWPVTPGMT